MQSPKLDPDAPPALVSYAHPRTVLRSVLPLSIAMTLIICGTIVMVVPIIATTVSGRPIGNDRDTEAAVLAIAGLVGVAMVVFGILKSMNRTAE